MATSSSSSPRVEVLEGDLFKSNAQTLVNTVNTVGVMGKGIALNFKRRFPEMYEDYVGRCRRGEVRLGQPYIYKSDAHQWIINFPTKDHWRSVARLDSIVAGLEYLHDRIDSWGVRSMAVPPLGCGEGGLEWRVVGPTLYRHLSSFGIPVELYAPFGTPHEELQPTYLQQLAMLMDEGEALPASRIPAGWVVLVAILNAIQREPYHHPIGRIAFQKLAYFATEEGVPTHLTFRRGSYGPWSQGVKPMETRLVNNGLIRERRLGRMIGIEVGPTFQDAIWAFDEILAEWKPTIERIADLMVRLDARRAEVASTVHFTAAELRSSLAKTPTESEVLAAVQEWKTRRKPPLADEEIAEAIRMLGLLGWIDVAPSRELAVKELRVVGV